MPPPASHSLLDPLGTASSLVILQYDLAVSYVPVLRRIVQDMIESQTQIIFVSVFGPISRTLGMVDSSLVHEVDLSGNIPGYTDEGSQPDVPALILDKISSIPKGSIALVVDSPDTLMSDLGSHASTINILSRAFGQIVQHSASSRLILPIISNSPLLATLLSTSFQVRGPRTSDTQPSAHTLTHLVFHPPALFSHLIQHYHVSLPPVNTPPEVSTARFWSVFAPVAGRGTGERLVMASGTDELGIASTTDTQPTSRESKSGVVEIVSRARTGGQKGVRRVLRGWRIDGKNQVTWCGWDEIPALKASSDPSAISAAPAPNAMDAVSFNLQLSEAQQQARASVPLPYTNDAFGTGQWSGSGEILYIPDQADDFDDDDPDDDLYI
ncbi:hypothetical protein BDV93DRAFT_527743 [Ceratobasidium sp. AG-I]|nr:hypothetical protein BDV93DRAFT_527743 [Ceratobasidium sp. AG-I]